MIIRLKPYQNRCLQGLSPSSAVILRLISIAMTADWLDSTEGQPGAIWLLFKELFPGDMQPSLALIQSQALLTYQ